MRSLNSGLLLRCGMCVVVTNFPFWRILFVIKSKEGKSVAVSLAPFLAEHNFPYLSVHWIWSWVKGPLPQSFKFFFFDRKRQRNILIKRRYKRRMRNPPSKEKQDYKKSKIRKYIKRKDTLVTRR